MRDVMDAIRQPGLSQPLGARREAQTTDARGQVIFNLEAKISRMRREHQRVIDLNKDLKIDVQILERDLRVAHATIVRLMDGGGA